MNKKLKRELLKSISNFLQKENEEIFKKWFNNEGIILVRWSENKPFAKETWDDAMSKIKLSFK